MPNTNGLEVTGRVRSLVLNRMHSCIILVTADAREENRLACAAAGMDEYLSKPVRIKELKGMLSKASNSERCPARDPASS